MTGPDAPAVAEAPPQPPAFVVRFPVGHERAGAVVDRKSSCSRCSSEFDQYEVNPEWLASFRQDAQDAYRRSCEVDEGGRIWQPARCPTCERLTLESTAPIHHLERPDVRSE